MSLLTAVASGLTPVTVPLPLGPVLPTHEAQPALTTTHYVDPANTSGAASDAATAAQAQNQATPWLTLGKAIAAAPADALVLILGPYTETVKPTISTARASWVTVRAAPGASISLAGILFAATASHIAFEGSSAKGELTGALVSTKSFDATAGASKIRLRNIPVTSVVLRATATAAVSDVIIDTMTIRPPLDTNGITFSAADTAVAISDVTISNSDLRTDSADCVHVGNPLRLLVENNDFHENLRTDTAAHVDCFQDVGIGQDVTIRNNVMRDSLVSQGIFASDGRILNLWIENNLLYGMGGVATYISIGSSQPNAVLLYNTILGRLRILGGATVSVLAGNIISSLVNDPASGVNVVEAEGFNLVNTVSGMSLAGSSVAGAPTFQNAANADYRLAAGSLGLGIGAASLNQRRSPVTDRRGVARPVAGAWDVGSDGRA